MTLAALLLMSAGLALSAWFADGEFAGSAEDAARRVRYRRLGVALTAAGLAIKIWIEFA